MSLIIRSPGKQLKAFLGETENISLIENNQLLTGDGEEVDIFLEYFESIVLSLSLQDPTEWIIRTDNPDPIQNATDKYQNLLRVKVISKNCTNKFQTSN